MRSPYLVCRCCAKIMSLPEVLFQTEFNVDIVVTGVWGLGDDNTTISKCDILAVCCRLPCPTHVLHSHRMTATAPA